MRDGEEHKFPVARGRSGTQYIHTHNQNESSGSPEVWGRGPGERQTLQGLGALYRLAGKRFSIRSPACMGSNPGPAISQLGEYMGRGQRGAQHTGSVLSYSEINEKEQKNIEN